MAGVRTKSLSPSETVVRGERVTIILPHTLRIPKSHKLQAISLYLSLSLSLYIYIYICMYRTGV
jgi:hypothetical protein